MEKHKLIILVHNIRSAYNVGSIFRTADGAGVTKIVLSGYSARPPHPGVLKVSLGAENSVPWEAIGQPGPWLRKLKQTGVTIMALEQTLQSKNIFTYHPRGTMVLVVGNEVRGVSPALLKLCDVHLEIPMVGKKESLNVATAFGIAVYQLLYGQK